MKRTQPSIDLVNRINVKNPNKIIDVGCGLGNSINIPFKKYSKANTLRIDNSENMINTAKKTCPNIRWKICDDSNDLGKLDSDYDIVFSNTCIQLIPEHSKLTGEMLGLLKNGGVIAVQVPNNHNEAINKIIKEVSTCEKWSCYF